MMQHLVLVKVPLLFLIVAMHNILLAVSGDHIRTIRIVILAPLIEGRIDIHDHIGFVIKTATFQLVYLNVSMLGLSIWTIWSA